MNELPAEQLLQFERSTERSVIPRVGLPEEAAEAYLYAMRGNYTTGQVLYVEGGALIAS